MNDVTQQNSGEAALAFVILSSVDDILDIFIPRKFL